MSAARRSSTDIHTIVAVVMLSIGLAIVVHGAYTAYTAFEQASLQVPELKTLEEALVYITNNLLSLAIKLAFLGLYIWTGSILIVRGIDMFKRPTETVKTLSKK